MHPVTIEAEIVQHFRNAGSKLTAESAILSTVIHEIIAKDLKVTNKAIILHLIALLDCTTDLAEQDVLRKMLEIVVGRTPDDEGF